MYILNTPYDGLYFISNDTANLEEMALSFFEDDWYDFFCYLLMDDNGPVEEMKKQAFHFAVKDCAPSYNISEVIFLD